MKSVDKLGRIVIPQHLREKYGFEDGVKINFFDTGEGIEIRAAKAFCKICHRRIYIDVCLPLCEQCISEAVKIYIERKRTAVE